MSAKCPACGAPTERAHKPFCSRGCKDRDLLKWLADGYRIPGLATDEDGTDEGGLREADKNLDKDDGAD